MNRFSISCVSEPRSATAQWHDAHAAGQQRSAWSSWSSTGLTG